MDLAAHDADARNAAERRSFHRLAVRSRARISIGTRHYIGYLHDISRAGAKLRTVTPIRKPGSVLLRLPDLPPLRCELRWNDACNAGVAFMVVLPDASLNQWLRTRLTVAESRPA